AAARLACGRQPWRARRRRAAARPARTGARSRSRPRPRTTHRARAAARPAPPRPAPSLDDLEQDPPVLLRAARADDGAQRPRDAAAAPDHAPEVVRGDPEAQDEVAVLPFLVDADLVRLLDEPARQVLDQLGGGGQARSFAFSSRETASEG